LYADRYNYIRLKGLAKGNGMRTNIFNKFAQLSKEFCEHIELLWELTSEQRKAIIPHVSLVYRTQTIGEKEAATEDAVKSIGGNAANILKLLTLLLYVYGEWNPIFDTPEDFVRDLRDLGLIPEDKAEAAGDFWIEFLSEVQSDNTRRLEKMYASSLLPSYKGCSTLVDFRAVIRNPYGSKPDEKIDDYQPRCVSYVPIVLIQIFRDAGEPRKVEFQCEESDLQLLIRTLEASLKDLEAARFALPGGDIE
jgi:hypothetical protein